MGTNYYLKETPKPPCECCKRPYETPNLHIGKSSAGWCFSLHVMPEQGIDSLADWQREWAKPGTHIVDEYGRRIPTEDMLSIITERGGHLVRHKDRHARYGGRTYDLIKGEFS